MSQFDPEKLTKKYGSKNQEAEKKLIAALILEGQMGESKRLGEAIKLGISDESFTNEDLGKIFNAARFIHDEGDTVDEISLLEEVGEEEIEGDTAAYLSELTDKFDSLNIFKRSLDTVHQKWMSRFLLSKSLSIAKRMIEEKSPSDAMNASAADLSDLQTGIIKEGTETLKDVVRKVRENIRNEHEGEEQKGVFFLRTGIDKFDKVAGAFSSGCDLLNILAAKPSVGKTSLVTQIMQHGLVDFPDGVFIDFQLENRRDNHVRQMASRFAKANLRKLRKEPEEVIAKMERYLDRVEEVADERLFVFDGNMTIEEITTKVRYIHRTHGNVKMVAIDYFQLIRSSNTRERNHVLIMEEISRALKNLAKEVVCPFFVLSQLTQQKDSDKPPTMEDLRWTKALAQDADRVIIIHDPEEVIDEAEGLHLRELRQAKNKYGPKGVVPVGFIGPYTEFIEIEEDTGGD